MNRTLCSLCVLLMVFNLNATDSTPKGHLAGQVVDEDIKIPLPALAVEIRELSLIVASDESGAFLFKEVPAGQYSLLVQGSGYRSKTVYDVAITPNRTQRIMIHLKSALHIKEEVVIEARIDQEQADAGEMSTKSFSFEEIRRSPGSAGDISRVINVLPSVAQLPSSFNTLVVRGGNPMENGFYIDGIEIPNINHFPFQGSGSGPIGLINMDFIEDVEFKAGGFGASFGNRLSAIMDMTFRQGNIQKVEGQVDLSMIGIGAVLEGPFPGEKGNWLFSARKSYLDLVSHMLSMGETVPNYSDFQFKAQLDLSQSCSVTMLGVIGLDQIEFKPESKMAKEMGVFGQSQSDAVTLGGNLFKLWSTDFHSSLSFSCNTTRHQDGFNHLKTGRLWVENNSKEDKIQLRNQNHWQVSPKISLTMGVNWLHELNKDHYFLQERISEKGERMPTLTIQGDQSSDMLGLHLESRIDLSKRLETILGVRLDHSDRDDLWWLSPRMAVSWQFLPHVNLNCAWGRYIQYLPPVFYSQVQDQMLRPPQADHSLLGLSWAMPRGVKLSLEFYHKGYRNLPIQRLHPDFFLMDEFSINRGGLYLNQLISEGSARSYGVEMILQKKLAQDFYGLLSFSWSKSEYQNSQEEWLPRSFDNGFVFSVEGGYRPAKTWEISLRWTYAGGVPYTPFDLGKSQMLQTGVYDLFRINTQRYPDFHSLNVRMDKRFYFHLSSLIIYVNVLNAYNRKNIDRYYWNIPENRQERADQLGIMPTLGIEYEF